MHGRVLTFSLPAALNPMRLAATTVMLTLLRPKRLLTGYLAGAAVTSVTCGLLLVFALSSGTSSTAKHSVNPILDIVLGGLLLLVVFVVRDGPGHAAQSQK